MADAVGAVGGLGFDGRVPPRVEVDDGVCFGEVEAEAAGFETDEEDAFFGVALEGVDLGGAVGGFAIDAAPCHVCGGDGGFDEVEHGGEGAEDEDRVAAVADFVEEFCEGLEFTGGGVRVIGGGGFGWGEAGEKTWVAAGLAEAEESCEHVETRLALLARVFGVDDLGCALAEEAGVEVALGWGEVAADDGFDFGGEVAGDVLFETAEETGGETAAETVDDLGGAACGEGEFVAFFEVVAGAEIAGSGELEDGPEIADAVFDRGSR